MRDIVPAHTTVKNGSSAPRVELPNNQKLIFSSASEILASNEDLRKSINFLTPGVKLVVKMREFSEFRMILLPR